MSNKKNFNLNLLDKVSLIDHNDNIISTMDKYEAHKHPAKLHRAISVWLINDRGQVLLQKRSSKKIVGSEWWANAVCGNVRPTESYLECANRRLKEEIGVETSEIVDLKIKPIYKFLYKAYCNKKYGEYELDQVYLGKYNGDFVLNPEEVIDVIWIDFKELIKQIGKVISSKQTLNMSLAQLKINTAPQTIAFFNKFDNSSVLKNRQSNKSILKIVDKLDNQLLAPWTCIMLGDDRLIKEIKLFLSN